MTDSPEAEDVAYYVYKRPLIGVLGEWFGWTLGWVCYWSARLGFRAFAERHVDEAIMLRRGNPGAIRTIGYLNSLDGRLAFSRGSIMISGKVVARGPFANKGFFATYHVAARSEERALELIGRWEWDAVPGSLRVESSDFSFDDPGAEGILWVSNGRSFYSDDD